MRSFAVKHEAVFGAIAATASSERPLPTGSRGYPLLGLLAIVALISAGAWRVARGDLYTSGSTLGYALGVTGGTMMLALLLYPVRKRIPMLRDFGQLRYWFRIHMILGILGPVFIVFHSTFHIGSLNAGVALSCMLLVAASGVVGRFIYRKIHHGLYGSRASLAELQATLARRRADLGSALERYPQIQREVNAFMTMAEHNPRDRWQRALHFLSLGWNRVLIARKVHQAIAASQLSIPGDHAMPKAELTALVRTVDEVLRTLQRQAQFSSYERLFALWHVAHIPFVYMLVISAIVHVVAVHMY